MRIKQSRRPGWGPPLEEISFPKTCVKFCCGSVIFRQGQPADSLFYIGAGKVQLTVLSSHGKSAIIATLGAGEIFGEGCLAGQRSRISSAVAVTDCTLDRVAKRTMARLLRQDHEVSGLLVTHLLARNARYESDLVQQLFNSTERRLARILLLLSRFGKDSRAEVVLHRVTQADLAKMVGTSRPRVSQFMNKFKKLRFIEYSRKGALTVHSGLLSVVLND